jgi:hypothetical protein
MRVLVVPDLRNPLVFGRDVETESRIISISYVGDFKKA